VRSAVSHKTILVVDDEKDIRELLSECLLDEGYAVSQVSNGAEALAMVPLLPRPCVVILDLIMPVMSGNEVHAALQADPALRDIPIIVSTSDPSRAPGGVPIMRKPLNLDRLLAMVAALA